MIATIEAFFDRVDDLRRTRRTLTDITAAATMADPIRDAETVLAAAHQLEAALRDVRTAATTASGHRSRQELASDIGTRPSALFTRRVGRGSSEAGGG